MNLDYEYKLELNIIKPYNTKRLSYFNVIIQLKVKVNFIKLFVQVISRE